MVKFIYSEKATKVWQNLPVDLLSSKSKTNELEHFVKFLWPSQKIWTLNRGKKATLKICLTQCAPLSSHGDNITWTFAPSRERGLVPVDVHQILLSQYFLFCFDKTLLCLVSVNIWPKNKWDDIWSKSVYYFFAKVHCPLHFVLQF